MQQKPNFFKTLQVMHKAFVMGMVLFVAIAIVLNVTGTMAQAAKSFDRTLQVIALLLAAGLPALGFSLFNKRVASLGEIADVHGRAAAYKSVTVLRWALIEMPALFAVVCFLLTGNYAYIALAIALVFVFAATNPSKTKVVFQMRLNDEEVRALENVSS